MKLTTKTIETERLILRKFHLDDAEDTYRNYCGDPLVTKYLTWTTYTGPQEAVDRMHFMQEQYQKGQAWDWAIELKELGQVIGSIGPVKKRDDIDMVHIGYCIGSRWWHQGIMTEAFSAVIDYLFSECGVNRIEALHDPNNPHSGAVMRKCGLRYEGTMRQADHNNQGVCDANLYAIIKEDWENPQREQHMRLPMKTLTTERLLLRTFVPEDAAGLYHNWASDTETTRYMGWDTYTSMEDADARMRYLQDQYARQSACEWAIVLRESGELIGSLGAYPSWDAAKSVEAGYIIGKRWWHQGLVPEAFSAAIRYLFTETEVLRIWAWHDSRNPNSGAVMRKCGMTCEGTMRQAGSTNAGICDMVIYSILRSDIVNATLI